MPYRLKLPPDCHIYPVFHIALLKEFKGDNPVDVEITVPPLSTESHSVILPTRIVAYHVINQKGRKVKQVLVEMEMKDHELECITDGNQSKLERTKRERKFKRQSDFIYY